MMPELMPKAVADFEQLLRRRLAAHVDTTEDGVRYTFFVALMRCGISPEQVILESSHPTISGAKIDTVIPGTGAWPDTAIEFKYDRANLKGTNQPRPQKAGK